MGSPAAINEYMWQELVVFGAILGGAVLRPGYFMQCSHRAFHL